MYRSLFTLEEIKIVNWISEYYNHPLVTGNSHIGKSVRMCESIQHQGNLYVNQCVTMATFIFISLQNCTCRDELTDCPVVANKTTTFLSLTIYREHYLYVFSLLVASLYGYFSKAVKSTLCSFISLSYFPPNC